MGMIVNFGWIQDIFRNPELASIISTALLAQNVSIDKVYSIEQNN